MESMKYVYIHVYITCISYVYVYCLNFIINRIAYIFLFTRFTFLLAVMIKLTIE